MTDTFITDACITDSATFLTRLNAHRPPQCANWQFDCVAETGSTNADLLTRFNTTSLARPAGVRGALQKIDAPLSWAQMSSLFPPVLRQAQRQTAGRGRLGRAWHSAPGDSLVFSLGVVLPRGLAGLAGLSLALGTALVAGLRQLPLQSDIRLSLKWPNDLLLCDARSGTPDIGKLGGMLIETAASSRYASALVIGIGLNLRGRRPSLDLSPASALRAPLPPAVLETALQTGDMSGGDALQADPAALQIQALAAVLSALDDALALFSASGFAAFQQAWWEMHHFAGQPVMVIDQDREQLRGTAVGVDVSGRLLIDTAPAAMPGAPTSPAGSGPSTIHAITAGDVSLRAASPADAS